jgi:hypothetical protein
MVSCERSPTQAVGARCRWARSMMQRRQAPPTRCTECKCRPCVRAAIASVTNLLPRAHSEAKANIAVAQSGVAVRCVRALSVCAWLTDCGGAVDWRRLRAAGETMYT